MVPFLLRSIIMLLSISWKNSMAGEFIGFSEDLVATEELDPVYCMLYKAKSSLGDDTVKRFMTAFYMFYHVGVASQLAETPSNKFWAKVGDIYSTAPRGKERRHYRGMVGTNSITSIFKFGSAEAFIDSMIKPTYLQIREHVKNNLNGFGDYMTWKIADMQDRVLGQHVDWDGADKYLHKVPIKGAALIAVDESMIGESLLSVIEYMERKLAHLKAPPTYDRALNIAEIETILCAYKGLKSGSYYLGKDIASKRKDLEGYGDMAQTMLGFMPKNIQPKIITSPLEAFYV